MYASSKSATQRFRRRWGAADDWLFFAAVFDHHLAAAVRVAEAVREQREERAGAAVGVQVALEVELDQAGAGVARAEGKAVVERHVLAGGRAQRQAGVLVREPGGSQSELE